MADMKIVVWNVEWMSDLFVPASQPPAFRPDDEKPTHSPGATIRKRRDDLAGVLRELAPDLAVLVEGPGRNEDLQLFFDQDLNEHTWKTHVQVSHAAGQPQNISLAVRTDSGSFQDPPFITFDTYKMKEFGDFKIDTDDDEISELYSFERRPLYVEIHPNPPALPFRILGLHLKSKGIFQAYEWSKWWAAAEANRRKILAEASQLRINFLDPYMTSPQTGEIPLIVCGDVNDGPGLDASEKRLYGSGIERLMGNIWKPELCLHNALFDALSKKEKKDLDFSKIATTRFRDPIFNDVTIRDWIDHLLYSPSDSTWVYNAKANENMPDGTPIWKKYPHSSDHYPITATISR
jgi:hypothetical protein